jgi:ribonuclease HII
MKLCCRQRSQVFQISLLLLLPYFQGMAFRLTSCTIKASSFLYRSSLQRSSFYPAVSGNLQGTMVQVAAINRRKSPRLSALESLSSTTPEHDKPPKPTAKAAKKARKVSSHHNETAKEPSSRAKRSKAAPPEEQASTVSQPTKGTTRLMLPRTREDTLKMNRPEFTWVMGIDEAGRGPLAGPVVAAAAIVPTEIDGITDSKKITCEDAREALYEQIVCSPGVSWAVAVVDAAAIDDINILQATMQAMSMAASALVINSPEAEAKWDESTKHPVCASRKGCYVTCGGKRLKPAATSSIIGKAVVPSYYALVDGNRLPKDLPCEGEAIVKGDSKEYSIAAASILAKVSRDRLMHAYHELYPDYNLSQHKGYPTKDHMTAVFKFGACPIHRRTFAPLKHMEFDEDGRVMHGDSS